MRATIRTETDFPAALKERYDTQEQKAYRLHVWGCAIQALLFLSTVATFGAALYYAHIAGQQRDVMELQSLIMNQAFAENRRQGFAVHRSAQAAIEAAPAAPRQAVTNEKALVESKRQKRGCVGCKHCRFAAIEYLGTGGH